MSQDSISRRRRAARSQRNRAVLVSSTEVEQNEADAQEAAVIEEPTTEVLSPEAPAREESEAEVLSPAPPKATPVSMMQRMRKLPGFFSTVGKGEQETTARGEDVAQARLARATRGKAVAQTGQAATAKENKPAEEKAGRPATTGKASTPQARPASPPSPFKTRYILGMGIYLFGASILGSYEQQLLRANHLDVLLAEFNLFGLPMRVSTSTVVFLASLILILVILARFDLIPRSFSAMSGTSTQGARQPERKTSKGEEGRGPQPTMRQGVKGADDKLYQEYRAHQRREKKR